MHVLVKWMESDPVFKTLGPLIVGIGILLLVSLILYALGYLI